MAKIKIYFDQRASAKTAQNPLKIAISHRGSTSYIPLNISLFPEQWNDESKKVINHPNKTNLNAIIVRRKAECDAILMRWAEKSKMLTLTATQIRDKLLLELNPELAAQKEAEIAYKNSFEQCFLRTMSHKSGRTKAIYEATYRRLQNFLGKRFKDVMFEEINKEWLTRFDEFLAITAPSANARNIHLRNIRTVFNDAIDNEVTTNYPFRKFKIHPTPTRKRNLSVDAIRKIFNAEGLEPWQEKYRDFFKLTFMLVGINVIDLCHLQEIEQGRVEYVRAKTHKPYSIKVEPEALEIINRYRGEKQLLSFMDTYTDYRAFYMNMCHGFKAIKAHLNEIDDGVEIKELTSYWARHSWATIASKLDIPKDTIAAALGHGGHTVTDIYIEFDMRKVDEANRKVLDFVLYDKEG